MATETWGTWAQVDMGATTATTVYTLPAPGVFELSIANRTVGAINVRAWVAVGGAGDDVKQSLVYDFPLAPYDRLVLLVTAAATDLIRGYASAVGTSWVVQGVKIT